MLIRLLSLCEPSPRLPSLCEHSPKLASLCEAQLPVLIPSDNIQVKFWSETSETPHHVRMDYQSWPRIHYISNKGKETCWILLPMMDPESSLLQGKMGKHVGVVLPVLDSKSTASLYSSQPLILNQLSYQAGQGNMFGCSPNSGL